MAPSQSICILPAHLMHKNRLQEYTQKLALPLPVYQTINEGFPHAPKFRSSVSVDGSNYTSKLTFLHRKAAEQEVAKYALECISMKISNEACPTSVNQLQIQDPLVCKSILNEFAFKSNRELPIYKTCCKGGTAASPVFISTLLFDGKTYTSEVAGSKKMAEQLAAHTAVRALLGTNSGNLLHEIVKSKGKLCSPSISTKVSSIAEPPSLPPETPSQQKRIILLRTTSPKRVSPTSAVLSNIPPPVAKFNSDNRGADPRMERRCISETPQHLEPTKRLNPFGNTMSPSTPEKCIIEMQKVEPKKITFNSSARPNAGQRTSGTRNVEWKKRPNSSARITAPNAQGKHVSEPQNVEPKKRINSCARLTGGSNIEGMRTPEAQDHADSRKRFNSLGILVAPNREGKRKLETQNMEQKKSLAARGRTIGPNMEEKRRLEIPKFEPKKKPSLRN